MDRDDSQPDYPSLITHYEVDTFEQGSRPSYRDGNRLLQCIFRDEDPVVIKPDREGAQVHLLRGKKTVPHGFSRDTPSVFLLNPVKEEVAAAIEAYNHVKAGSADSVGSFRNFRFEYDLNAECIKYVGNAGKVEQLTFLQQSRLPVTALIDTGNKSIQAILSIDGVETAEEYRLIAYAILARLPGLPDAEALKPNAPIWLPGGTRILNNDSVSNIAYPRLLFDGKPITKQEIHSWIATHSILSPEFLTHLDVRAKISWAEHDTLSHEDEAILQAIELAGGNTVGENNEGWTVTCPFHSDKQASAFVFKESGWLHCHAGCERRFLVSLGDGIVERKSQFSKEELLDAYRIGLDEEDLKAEKAEQKHIAGSVSLRKLLADHKKLLNRIGEEESTCFRLSFDNLRDCLSAWTLMKVVGQVAFYGMDGEYNYFVLCLYTQPIEKNIFVNFVCSAIDVSGSRWKAVVSGITKPDSGDLQVCYPGVDLTTEGLNRLFSVDPQFWVDHFFGKNCFERIQGERRHRRLRKLFPNQAKKLTPSIRASIEATLDPAAMAAEEWKFETLRGLLPKPKKDEIVPLETLAEAGVATGYLLKKGLEIAPRTRQNFVSLTKFTEVLGWEENRKKPIISNIFANRGSSSRDDLLYIIRSEVIDRTSSYFCLVAPAGYGKSTFLQQSLPWQLTLLGFQSAVIAKERVLDVIGGEAKANDQRALEAASPHQDAANAVLQDLMRTPPSRMVRIGKPRFDLPSELPEDFEDDYDYERDDERWFEALDEMDRLSPPKTHNNPPPVYAGIGYKHEICLRKDKKPNDKVPRNFCQQCEFTTCRAHPELKKKHPFQEIVISTHAAAKGARRDLSHYQAAEDAVSVPRSVVVFDEKPSDVFESFSLTVKKDHVKEIDEAILAIRGSDDLLAKKALPYLQESRSRVLKRFSDAKMSPTKLKRSKNKSDSYIRMADLSPVYAPEDIADALERVASKLATLHEQYKIDGLANLFRSLLYYKGPIVEELKLSLSGQEMKIQWGMPKWHTLRSHWRNHFIVMDATAFIDPDYSMPGAPKLVRIDNQQRFSNLTFHCTMKGDTSKAKAKKNWESEYRDHLVSLARKITDGFPNDEVLIVTSKDLSGDVKTALNCFNKVNVNYFGNLKGSNEYRECRHIVLTNFMRWTVPAYLLRAFWLSESGQIPGVKQHFSPVGNGILKNKGKFCGGEFKETDLEMLRLQYDTADAIQTIMRTALRQGTENEVHVWLPGQNYRRIGMLLDYFVGASVEPYSETAGS